MKRLGHLQFSKVFDIEISIVGNGKIYIFKHPAYFSKDFWEIYIEKFNKIWKSNLHWDIYGSNKNDPEN